ncbi:MAG TPA: ComF family protein [Candidatus Acidoferrum sp.]|nr:ComF family protein [Candidatus Acidoferrum sp.]
MSAVVESLRSWVNAGLALAYPEVCQLCGDARATPAEGFVCGDCRSKVRFIERPFCERCGRPYEGAITGAFECPNCRERELHFVQARSAVVACETMLEVIHRYKYTRAMWFEPFLGELLVQAAQAELAAEHWDFIVPVPLYPARQREREFNQAERLARYLSAATQVAVNSRLLRRVRPTCTQTVLSRAEREENVRGAFALRRGQRLNGERIVLVDDVLTTGATTSACAKVLRDASAGDVYVWTVARGI